MQNRRAWGQAREQRVFGDPEGFDLPSADSANLRQEQTERWAYAFAGVAVIAAVAGALVNARTNSSVATGLVLAVPELVLLAVLAALHLGRNRSTGRAAPADHLSSTATPPVDMPARYAASPEDAEDYLEVWFPFDESDETGSAVDLDEIEAIAKADEELADPVLQREAG